MTSATQQIAACTGKALPLPKSHTLRITNAHGGQVVDFWAFTLSPDRELVAFLSLPHTRASTLHLRPRVADILASNLRLPLLRIAADTGPGVHDTLIAACDPQRYRQLGVRDDEGHASCATNLREALAAMGVAWPRGSALLEHWTPAPLNLWMNIPVEGEHGDLSFQPALCRPGDYVEMTALADDVVVVMSCCPQDMVPINGVDMVPRGVEYVVMSP